MVFSVLCWLLRSPLINILPLVVPEAVAQRCSVKNMFLEISQNSQENTSARVSFLIKLQASGTDTLAQVFSCDFYNIFKDTFFTEHRWAAASDYTIKVLFSWYHKSLYCLLFNAVFSFMK